MTLSHWLIHILSQRLVAEVCTRCDNAAFAHFVAAISHTNSNWFEFVRLIAATKFCHSDKDCRKNAGTMSHEATCCSDLSPSVNNILFNEDIVLWQDYALAATSDNIKTGKAFLDERVQAGGLTNINDALLLALKILRNTVNQTDSPIADNFPMVLFLTDGLPTEGLTDTKMIRSNILKAKASIFALRFGSIYQLDLDFLTALSFENGGTSRRIYPDEDAASQLEGFSTRSAHLCCSESISSIPAI